jgi:pyruvate/2-oxoglutarate dehydrogenase complex dihydrolipoamide dehydrogenase (E3) component
MPGPRISGMKTGHYDAIVIGAGQGGVPLSVSLGQAGRHTALVERAYVGGTCINYGCTPTKTMVASGRVAYLAGRAGDYGLRAGSVEVDINAVRQRKREVVESFRESTRRRIESAPNIDLIFGQAAFSGERTIRLDGEEGASAELTADLVFINSGCRPARPAFLEGLPVLDSTSVMELDEVPRHLIVLGGGYVGLEFAQLFRRLGSQVSVVQRGPQLLAQEDPDVAEAVAAILSQDGVEVLLQASALGAAQGKDGSITLDVRTPDGDRTLVGTHLLAAAGRTPNTAELSLQSTGVETDQRGYIRVDNRLQTSAPGVYALGDIKGGPAFTHISYDDFRIIRTNLLEGGSATTDGRLVPYTVFIDPQLGRVGMSETQARAQGRRVRVAKQPMTSVARAVEIDESRGLMKAVVDAESSEILGCAILGIEGGELMGLIEVAMLGGLRYPVLRDAIFAHPTLAESLNNLFGSFVE